MEKLETQAYSRLDRGFVVTKNGRNIGFCNCEVAKRLYLSDNPSIQIEQQSNLNIGFLQEL